MQSTRKSAPGVVLLIGLMLLAGGCSNQSPAAAPGPTPYPAALTPEKAVIGFWSDIDNGRYAEAYGFTYHDQNTSYQDWIDDHKGTYGANGSDLEIYSFAIADSFPVEPDAFGGNFSAAQVVVVDAKLAYRSENRTGTVQFPVVKTPEGWKIYGDY